MNMLIGAKVYVNKTGLFEMIEHYHYGNFETGGILRSRNIARAVLLSATVIREKKKKKKIHFR